MTTTQSPYLVVEDDGGTTDTMEETSTGDEDKELPSCKTIMANNGLNFSSFWHGAAHGIHSLYLEEIREWFEPGATVNNKIPVVNANLSDEHTILFDVPLAGYDKDFKTMALKVMAYFMLNDRPDFATQGLNTLEKITHQYHMHEIYAAAAPIYRNMKENPATDPELCPCVNDITGNGILTEMVNIARQLKYFNSKRQPRSAGRARYYGKRSAENVSREDIVAYEKAYLADSSYENAARLESVAPWKGNQLLGPDQWIAYEAMLTKIMLDEEELNDFAVFMYCKLNQPELDHPKELFD